MKVEIVDANLSHLFDVIEDLRDFEREQCKKMFGDKLEQEAARILCRSLLAYAALVDGRCVLVYGIFTDKLLAEEGWLWMLGTKFLEEHPLAFLRHSKRHLDSIRPIFKKLCGVVLSDLPCGEKWLRWLGFDVGPDCEGLRPFVTR